MSIRNPTEIRYLKRDQLEEENKILYNYYRDLIRQYGVDVTYLKNSVQYPRIINPTLSSYEDIIYGENLSTSYDASANLIMFLEVEQDLFTLNQQGSLMSQNYIGTIDINTFSSSFAYLNGNNDEFKTELSISGIVNNFSTTLSSYFDIEGLSGNLSSVISLSSMTNGYFSPDIYNLTPDYKREVLINPYIKESKSYEIVDDSDTVAFIGEYTATLDASGNGTIDTSLSGSLLYASLDSFNRTRGKIRPNIGDIIKIDFPSDVQQEEYEITNIYDRLLSDSGINPLLGKYLYRCDMVRRTPSDETIFGDDEFMEQDAKEFLDVLEKTQHARDIISDDVDDYVDDVDDVYGGYGDTDDDDPDVDEYIIF